jgi:hypothetical protein
MRKGSSVDCSSNPELSHFLRMLLLLRMLLRQRRGGIAGPVSPKRGRM